MADKSMNAKISVDFEESASRQSLNSGDSLPTLFGKTKRFFSDLKSVALSGSYNDLTDTPEALPASDVADWAKAATKPTYTATEIGLGNVENKSSATIRSEITADNVTEALGFTPMEDTTVPITKGGTGATTAKAAEYYITASMTEETDELSDVTQVPFVYAGASATKGRFYWRKVTYLWNYIKDKISSVLGLTATQYNGNAKTATSATKATGDSDGNAINTTYLKKSGGEMTGSITYPERTNGSKVSYGNTGIVLNTPSDNGYAANLLAVHSEDNSTVLGGFGVHGSNDAISYYYIGETYANPIFKFTSKGELTTTKFIGALQGNADTATKVNNHTVESDVPANAKFTDTTYSAATTSANGLMTSAMVTKLNGIATGATKVTVDSTMSTTSTNPVQNKVIKAAIDELASSGGIRVATGSFSSYSGTINCGFAPKLVICVSTSSNAYSDIAMINGVFNGNSISLRDNGFYYYFTSVYASGNYVAIG